ncbi:MAG: hypothetical protein WCP29_02250 [Acidobacteriota bacterium]
MGIYYLVMDSELKTLLDKFSRCHPEGSKDVLKLVLKLYLKLVDKSRRKGADPLLVFQNLVERIVSGKLYETTQDRIDHLDSLLEERHAGPAVGENGSGLRQEMSEIKAMLRGLQMTGGAGPNYGQEMREFSPKDAAKLLVIDKEAPSEKKRQNYRELRKQRTPKKMEF